MKIWIDICHTPQFNFYKELILRLSEQGHEVLVTVLRRGKTPVIVHREIGEVSHVHIYEVGRHRMTKLSAMLEANILRNVQLFFWRLFHRVDLAFGNGMQPAIIQWIFRGPSYSFDDDPQTVDFGPKVHCNTECNFCLYEDPSVERRGAHVLRCLKEWASLAPNVFTPNLKALEVYRLSPKRYIVLREVTVGTINYVGQAPDSILAMADKIETFRLENNMQVVLSLEKKDRRNDYPADWILLQEPVKDIHSLIYYAAGLVSSGDSMAREAALLGIPAYYLGVRHSMPANKAASKVAQLQNELTMSFETWLEGLTTDEEKQMKEQAALRAKINSEFIDINAYMLKLVGELQ